jgi:hypothetical protein
LGAAAYRSRNDRNHNGDTNDDSDHAHHDDD